MEGIVLPEPVAEVLEQKLEDSFHGGYSYWFTVGRAHRTNAAENSGSFSSRRLMLLGTSSMAWHHPLSKKEKPSRLLAVRRFEKLRRGGPRWLLTVEL
ncbi:MAG TPA: hypothetical protein VMU38_05460 [Candidatus Binatia bacterium]|nr:hypothetical protein [Candidatus Binatia bacterium]